MVDTWNWNLTIPGIEKLKELVVGALAVNLGQLEVLVVEALHDSGGAARSPMRLYSSAARFTSSMVGFFGPSKLGTKHLSEAQHLWPRRCGRPDLFAIRRWRSDC
jgi:hypothetical protein